MPRETKRTVLMTYRTLWKHEPAEVIPASSWPAAAQHPGYATATLLGEAGVVVAASLPLAVAGGVAVLAFWHHAPRLLLGCKDGFKGLHLVEALWPGCNGGLHRRPGGHGRPGCWAAKTQEQSNRQEYCESWPALSRAQIMRGSISCASASLHFHLGRRPGKRMAVPCIPSRAPAPAAGPET